MSTPGPLFEVEVISSAPLEQPPDTWDTRCRLEGFAKEAERRGKRKLPHSGKVGRLWRLLLARLRLEPDPKQASRLLWSGNAPLPRFLRALLLHQAFPRQFPRPRATLVTLRLRRLVRGAHLSANGRGQPGAILTRIAAEASPSNAFTRRFGKRARTAHLPASDLWLASRLRPRAGGWELLAVAPEPWLRHLRPGLRFPTSARNS